MYNRRYDKKFLMLRQEVAGYSTGQKTPWGSCAIEIKNNKGTLNVKVQGLRNLTKQSYDIYMIGGQERSIYCKTLELDSKGQGEFSYAFAPDGIGEFGVAIEDIHTIAVIVDDGRDHQIAAPLVAYVGEKTDWKPYFQKANRIEKEMKVPTFLSNQKENIPQKTETIPTKESLPKPVEKIKEFPQAESPDKKVLLSFSVDNSKKSPYSGKRVTKPEPAEEVYVAKRTNPQNQNDLKVAENVELSISNPFMTMPWERKVFQEESPDTYHGSFRGLIEKFRKELTDLENEGIFTENDIKKIAEAGEVVDRSVDIKEIEVDIVDKYVGEAVDTLPAIVDKSVDTVDKKIGSTELSTKKMGITGNPKRFSTNKSSQLFKNHLKVQPFLETPDEVWTCITLDELLYIREIPIAWQRDLFFLYPMKKYGHLLYREENGEKFVAVPIEKKDVALFEKEAEMRAFQRFSPIQVGDIGYFVRSFS
ncbi:MAG: hypothetical protein R3Y53_01315 [Bacillota bacterium]